jgi:hypothetical protein
MQHGGEPGSSNGLDVDVVRNNEEALLPGHRWLALAVAVFLRDTTAVDRGRGAGCFPGLLALVSGAKAETASRDISGGDLNISSK